jgi:tRNA U34 5-carboxymethylaminomethyl modifying GTPase MnmE/TrmE
VTATGALEPPRELVASLATVERVLAGPDLAAWPSRDEDLARLANLRARLERRFTLAVAGEFSSGKSYLLNALLGKVSRASDGRIAGLLAVDINPSTATITELEYAAEPEAFARFPSGREERIPLDRLARFVAVAGDAPGALHDATGDDDSAPSFVIVRVDSPFLAGGFVVADTPGLASLNPAHRRATLAYLPRTDAVLYLIDTQQPFSEGDAAFLGLIGEHVRTIFIVQTKIDLWRQAESDGRAAWEVARGRIVAQAARYAPQAEVFSVSAREYAESLLDASPELGERSGFPALIAGLERSLGERARAARIARATSALAALIVTSTQRLRRESELLDRAPDELAAARATAESDLAVRERALARKRDEVSRAGAERAAWVREAGERLSADVVRALAGAIDVADIERIRDRGRFHGLVDATVGRIVTQFARDLAAHVSRSLERIERESPGLRTLEAAAAKFGGEPGVGAWSRDLASGLASTIVLGAIGQPALSFVQAVASAFAGRPPGAYMKRELGADLNATFLPALERDLSAFVEDIATRVAATYDDLAAALDRERRDLRSETLGPIERAVDASADPAERNARLARLRALLDELNATSETLERFSGETRASASVQSGNGQALASVDFNTAAYDRGLRPERYRVVVLGGLSRGKSSLINAVAGRRVLEDSGGSAALYPIHVRYGERERSYALDEGEWREIPLDETLAQAARSAVLIEVPWELPRQLVLVHAPAFDSGDPQAEEIALAAAHAASEVIGLFSRQLSERELSLYARVGELGKPMLLAHTIADNESASERRTVAELAARYLKERSIPVRRLFIVSALDYSEAAREGRPAAAWNELGALRETVVAHAEEHMQRLAERERRRETNGAGAAAEVNLERSSRPNLRRALDRLLGRE